MKEGLYEPTREGATQGSPLSPLLSNVVLDELDKELERRGLSFCRFADDCNIFTSSRKSAERVMSSLCRYIESHLKLEVNREKSQVALSDQITFLGMTIINGTIAISAPSIKTAMAKVKSLTPRGTSEDLKRTMSRINQWYEGWSNYYSMTQYPAQLAKIEARIRRRLRSRIISQQKKRRHLYNRLIERGIKPRTAKKAVYSNRKRWALSHTFPVEKAYSVAWFEETIGQIVRSRDKEPHWFDRNKWIKLT